MEGLQAWRIYVKDWKRNSAETELDTTVQATYIQMLNQWNAYGVQLINSVISKSMIPRANDWVAIQYG